MTVNVSAHRIVTMSTQLLSRKGSHWRNYEFFDAVGNSVLEVTVYMSPDTPDIFTNYMAEDVDGVPYE